MPRPFLLVLASMFLVFYFSFRIYFRPSAGVWDTAKTREHASNFLFFCKMNAGFGLYHSTVFLPLVFVLGFCSGSAAVPSAEQPHVIVSMICICHSNKILLQCFLCPLCTSTTPPDNCFHHKNPTFKVINGMKKQKFPLTFTSPGCS